LALTANHGKATGYASQSVATFHGSSGAKPIGLHFDVEPYTLPVWLTDNLLVNLAFLRLCTISPCD